MKRSVLWEQLLAKGRYCDCIGQWNRLDGYGKSGKRNSG